MRGFNHSYAASDGGGIGAISVLILLVGLLVVAFALNKYRKNETDHALILGALGAVAIFMALGVLSK